MKLRMDTRDHFAPIHTMPYYRELLQITSDDTEHGALPVTECESRRLVALPLYPGIGDRRIRTVGRHLTEAIALRT